MYDYNSGICIIDPCRSIVMDIDLSVGELEVESKKFNPLWLLNIGVVALCLVSVVLIAWVSIKYGGTLGKIVWVYPAFYLGQIASMFIIDPIHKFWNVKYKSVNNGKIKV